MPTNRKTAKPETLTIGQCLRAARVRAKLTQAQASKATGISQGNVSEYESGKLGNPSLSMLLTFSRAYGVRLSEMVEGL